MTTLEAQLPQEGQPAGAPGSLARRIGDTFFSPGALFARLGPTPPWADVLFISAVLGTVAMAALPAEVWTEMARESIRQIEDPQARASMSVETMARASRVMAPIGSFVMTFVMAFAVAGLLKLVFGVALRGEATFAQYRSLASHASLLTVAGLLLTVPVWIATGDMTLRLSPALFLPEGSTGFLPTLLNGADVFTLAWLAVLSVGVTALNRRVSIATSAGAVFGIYAAIVVVAALVTAR